MSAHSSHCSFRLVLFGLLVVLENWIIMLKGNLPTEAARKEGNEVQVTSGLLRIAPPPPSNTARDSRPRCSGDAGEVPPLPSEEEKRI
ncbi:hypothetical protein VZT92_008323 [Zoarces viviparus]|uniref:Uncharacterized protein n=1 Tax=Zoarces viviparus TaxID=48416 RepID=A0AAW1FF61_ZOAVI